MNKNKIIKIVFIVILFSISIHVEAEIFDDNNLNFFNEKKTQVKNKNTKNENHENEIIMTSSDIRVHSVNDLSKQELEAFPKDYLINCTDIKKAILYVNEDMLRKFKTEFDINDQISFKKVNNFSFEIPFYFSKSEKCIFNKDKNSNTELYNKVMSVVRNYIIFNKR